MANTNSRQENDSTDNTNSTASTAIEADGPAYEVEITDVYELDSPECYVSVLRYLYGLPLCAEGEHLSALALRNVRRILRIRHPKPPPARPS